MRGPYLKNVGSCKIENCERVAHSKGMCRLHHTRWYRTGNAGKAELVKPSQGEGSVNSDGYLGKMVNYKQILVHREIAEKALGKHLPPGSIVHHLNKDRQDNRPCNLVVCPDEAYHKLLHQRQAELGYNGPEHTEEYKARQAKGAALTLENLFSKV